MASIKFILKSDANPAAIYVRLIDGRKIDVMAKTNFVINPSDWSKAKEQPKNLNDADFKKLNSKLHTLKSKLLSEYNNLEGQTIDTKWLKNFLNPSKEVEGFPSDLVGYLAMYTVLKSKSITQSSIKKFNVFANKIDKFQIAYGSKILIKDIDRKLIKSFEDYSENNRYAHNTIARDIRFIKTVCRHAKDNGVDTHFQMEGITAKYQSVDNIYLKETELARIKELADLSESLDNVRDWLLISCYCGQRVSDFMRFNIEMIRREQGQKGMISLIEFEQKKTGKIMTLPLHSEVIKIIDKRGKFPPVISDQKYNEYIKIVCEKAGINELVTGSKKTETAKDSGVFRKESGTYPKHELVTSHIGRRSFASNFYGKIPTSLLIAATGHSTEAMFLNYIGKSSSDRAHELAQYFI
jgi:integrase